ncbi:MAG: acyl-CoA dehydrogenase family protein [Solirubrobacteraceae bacterium]
MSATPVHVSRDNRRRRAGVPPLVDTASAVAVADRVANSLRGTAAIRDQTRLLPTDEIKVVTDAGLFAVSVPQTFGGPGLPSSTVIEVCRALASADPSVAQIGQNHFAALHAMPTFGFTTATIARVCADVRDGAHLSTATAEQRGRDALANTSTLELQSDGSYVFNGLKFYSTGVFSSTWILATGRNGDDAQLVALVRRDAPGVEVLDDWTGMGQRGTGSGTTRFTDVVVAADHVAALTLSADQPLPLLGQTIHAAIEVGIARGAFEDAVDFARTKARPWIDADVASASQDPYVTARIGELASHLHAAEALLREAAAQVDQADAGQSHDGFTSARVAVAEAKAFGGAVALEIGSALFDVTGSRGVLDEHDLDRHWRNTRTHTLHAPSKWTHHHIGNWILNGTPPPQNGHI